MPRHFTLLTICLVIGHQLPGDRHLPSLGRQARQRGRVRWEGGVPVFEVRP